MKEQEIETKHILHIPTGLIYPVIVNKGFTYDIRDLFILAIDQNDRRMINPRFHYSMSFNTFLTKCCGYNVYEVHEAILSHNIEFEAI